MTGSLDDEQIRIIADELLRPRALDERRASILASMEEQGKLTVELRERILKELRVVFWITNGFICG